MGEKKTMKRIGSIALSLALVLVAVLSALPATASEGRHRSAKSVAEFAGIVTQVSSQSLTIRSSNQVDRVVQLTTATTVRIGGQASTVAAIKVGDQVEVHATAAADGSLTAVSLEIEDGASEDIHGVVKTVTTTSLTVTTATGDVTVALTADTHVFADDAPALATAILTGLHVEVDATRLADGTFAATLVRLESKAGELEGVITAVTPTSINVRKRDGSSVAITIASTTVIRLGGDASTAAFLTVGSTVEVEAVQNADGTFTAVTVNVDRADKFSEINGTVTTVGASQIHVLTRSGDDVTFNVTSATIIRRRGQIVALSTVVVGDAVEVHSQKAADGSSVAVRIEVESEGNDHENEQVEFSGVIATIAGSAITVNGGGASTVVNVSTTTTIRGSSNAVLTLSQLNVGDQVEVHATRSADGTLQAVSINVEKESEGGHGHDQAVEIKGDLTAVSATSVTVGAKGSASVIVAVDGATTVQNKKGQTASVSDLKVGQSVEITATRKTDGSLLATSIKIDD
jgi:hypothetical protein